MLTGASAMRALFDLPRGELRDRRSYPRRAFLRNVTELGFPFVVGATNADAPSIARIYSLWFSGRSSGPTSNQGGMHL